MFASAVDPDPDSMEFLDPYPDPRGQKWKKLINFIFWSAGCSLLRAEVFSCSLDIENCNFWYKKFFICIFFFSFRHQNPGSGFTWNAGSGSVSGSGFNESGSTALNCLHCRNNVLHLWPYNIHDLKALGAKKFYGKFCAGSIDHISIRWPQLYSIPGQNKVTHLFHPCPKPGRWRFSWRNYSIHDQNREGRFLTGDTIIPSLSKIWEGAISIKRHNYSLCPKP